MRVRDRPGHRLEMIGRLAETWFHRPPSPVRAVVDITRRCNLRCEMCHTWKTAGDGELTAAEIDDLIDQLPRLCWLDVTGGEPFMRRDAETILTSIARRAAALKVLHFQTNGWFGDRVARCARALARVRGPQVIITVSLDGPPQVHDRVRGRSGSFSRALDTFRRLQAIDGVEVYIGTTITPTTAPHVEALESVLRSEIADFHPRLWHWNWLQISEHFFQNGHLRNVDVPAGALLRQHRRRRGRPRSLVDLMESVFLINLEFVQRGEPSKVPCQALRSTLFIAPEGDVYPCHVYDRRLGNVRHQRIDEIWNAPATVGARSDIEALACGGCFTPCEAYPALAGAPGRAAVATAQRALRLWYEDRRARR